ncbi:hypothetical protein D3C81_2240460 [compost metagenome]
MLVATKVKLNFEKICINIINSFSCVAVTIATSIALIEDHWDIFFVIVVTHD